MQRPMIKKQTFWFPRAEGTAVGTFQAAAAATEATEATEWCGERLVLLSFE